MHDINPEFPSEPISDDHPHQIIRNPYQQRLEGVFCHRCGRELREFRLKVKPKEDRVVAFCRNCYIIYRIEVDEEIPECPVCGYFTMVRFNEENEYKCQWCGFKIGLERWDEEQLDDPEGFSHIDPSDEPAHEG